MDRRTYLAAVATALAGCGQQGSESSPSATDTRAMPSSTTTDSPTATATSTRTLTDRATETETPTETEAETATETETPTETATPTPDPREDKLDQAASLLADAAETYIATAQPLGDLTEMHAGFRVRVGDVRTPLSDARDPLKELEDRDLTDEQATRLERCWGTQWFLWWLPEVHNALADAAGRVGNAWSKNLDENPNGVSIELSQAEDDLEGVGEPLEKLRDDSEPADMKAFDRLSPAAYRAKIDQIEAERSQTTSIAGPLSDVADALAALLDGIDDYDEASESTAFEKAADHFFDAEQRFDDAVTGFEAIEWTPAYAGIVDDALCVARAMKAGCGHLDEAAQEAAEGNSERQAAAEEDAKAAFEDCDLIFEDGNFTTITTFFE